MNFGNQSSKARNAMRLDNSGKILKAFQLQQLEEKIPSNECLLGSSAYTLTGTLTGTGCNIILDGSSDSKSFLNKLKISGNFQDPANLKVINGDEFKYEFNYKLGGNQYEFVYLMEPKEDGSLININKTYALEYQSGSLNSLNIDGNFTSIDNIITPIILKGPNGNKLFSNLYQTGLFHGKEKITRFNKSSDFNIALKEKLSNSSVNNTENGNQISHISFHYYDTPIKFGDVIGTVIGYVGSESSTTLLDFNNKFVFIHNSNNFTIYNTNENTFENINKETLGFCGDTASFISSPIGIYNDKFISYYKCTNSSEYGIYVFDYPTRTFSLLKTHLQEVPKDPYIKSVVVFDENIYYIIKNKLYSYNFSNGINKLEKDLSFINSNSELFNAVGNSSNLLLYVSNGSTSNSIKNYIYNTVESSLTEIEPLYKHSISKSLSGYPKFYNNYLYFSDYTVKNGFSEGGYKKLNVDTKMLESITESEYQSSGEIYNRFSGYKLQNSIGINYFLKNSFLYKYNANNPLGFSFKDSIYKSNEIANTSTGIYINVNATIPNGTDYKFYLANKNSQAELWATDNEYVDIMEDRINIMNNTLWDEVKTKISVGGVILLTKNGTSQEFTISSIIDDGMNEIRLNSDATDYFGASASAGSVNYKEILKSKLDGNTLIELETEFGELTNSLWYKIELIGDSNDNTKTPVINSVQFLK